MNKKPIFSGSDLPVYKGYDKENSVCKNQGPFKCFFKKVPKRQLPRFKVNQPGHGGEKGINKTDSTCSIQNKHNLVIGTLAMYLHTSVAQE